MSNRDSRRSAFSMLELLVVISIIGILITVGTVSYSTAQKKARDAKRKTDLKAIQNAFEQYYSVCGYKYGVTVTGNLSGDLTCTSINPNITVITYPTDPLGANYQCVGSCTVSSYTVCPPDLDAGVYLETESCSSANPVCCLRNQQ